MLVVAWVTFTAPVGPSLVEGVVAVEAEEKKAMQ